MYHKNEDCSGGICTYTNEDCSGGICTYCPLCRWSLRVEVALWAYSVWAYFLRTVEVGLSRPPFIWVILRNDYFVVSQISPVYVFLFQWLDDEYTDNRSCQRKYGSFVRYSVVPVDVIEKEQWFNIFLLGGGFFISPFLIRISMFLKINNWIHSS